jgi:lysozyme family protein
MAGMRFDAALKAEYQLLFSQAAIRPERRFEVDAILRRITAPQAMARYRAVEAATGVPAHLVGIIHNLEASGNFDRHLHNGDPLTVRTVRVPAGRPRGGRPPFAWQDSAADALLLKKLDRWTDWSVPGTAYVLEQFNGWGYRRFHPHVKSPYLWGFSTIYAAGKYVADGVWSDTAVSRQCGGMTALLALAQAGLVTLAQPAAPAGEAGAVAIPFSEAQPGDVLAPANPPAYPGRLLRNGSTGRAVETVQARLLELGLRDLGGVDGDFGDRTEWAVRQFQARSIDHEGLPLEVDGIVGPRTWGALFGLAAMPPPAPAPAAGDFAAALLTRASAEIGVREMPPGSNRGPQVDAYLSRVSPTLLGQPWCMAFVYWCHDEAARALGRPNPAPRTAGVHRGWQDAGLAAGGTVVTAAQAAQDPSLVRPGMVFFIDTGGGKGHAGIVADLVGSRLVTIEGNTNDGGSREGIGVFARSGRRIAEINLGFAAFG